MKKFATLLVMLLLSSLTILTNPFGQDGLRYFNFHECNVKHTTNIDYHKCIHLVDGNYLLSFEEEYELTYLHVNTNGLTKEIKMPYEIYGQHKDGTFIVQDEVLVSTGFDSIMSDGYVYKYGVSDEEGNILIEPILDINPIYYAGQLPEVYVLENDIVQYKYGATIIDKKVDGINSVIPRNSKNILINSDYKTWKDYDVFYDNFITEDRFIVKDSGKSILIDGDMNIITDKYTHIIELDDGKWYASTDPSQTNPVYSIVLDNDGNIITDFDPKLENDISDWAKPYVDRANEMGIIELDETTAFNTSFFQEEITRIEFCRLIVNTLKSIDHILPKIKDFDTFSDTKDENVLICHWFGIIDGVGDDKFDPYSNLTREQAAKIIEQLSYLIDIDTSNKSDENKFIDLDMASDWAKDYILQVSSLKTQNNESIMGGTSENTFSPIDPYTVEQAITILIRFTNL